DDQRLRLGGKLKSARRLCGYFELQQLGSKAVIRLCGQVQPTRVTQINGARLEWRIAREGLENQRRLRPLRGALEVLEIGDEAGETEHGARIPVLRTSPEC